MGFYFAVGNSAGFISSNIYPSKEAPRYIKGIVPRDSPNFYAPFLLTLSVFNKGKL
jgi:hypothetical protein